MERKAYPLAAGRTEQPAAAIFDGRTLQSTPESGARAGFDADKKKRGGKVHLAVNTVGYLLSLHVISAHEHERVQVAVRTRDPTHHGHTSFRNDYGLCSTTRGYMRQSSRSPSPLRRQLRPHCVADYILNCALERIADQDSYKR